MIEPLESIEQVAVRLLAKTPAVNGPILRVGFTRSITVSKVILFSETDRTGPMYTASPLNPGESLGMREPQDWKPVN